MRKGQVELDVDAAVRSREAGWEFVRVLEDGGDFYDVYPKSENGNEFRYGIRYRPQTGPPPLRAAAAPAARPETASDGGASPSPARGPPNEALLAPPAAGSRARAPRAQRRRRTSPTPCRAPPRSGTSPPARWSCATRSPRSAPGWRGCGSARAPSKANTADVARFYQALGRKESLLKIQEDIVGIARQLGLTLGSRSYTNEAVKGSDSLARFRITMPISGSYRQVVSFLQRIEALPHFVTVDSISLREDSGGGGRSTNLNVVLSVYFLDAEPGDAD